MNVESSIPFTLDEINYLITLFESRIALDEQRISFIRNSSFLPSGKAKLISERTQSINLDKSLIEKLEFLCSELLKNERT